MKQSLDACKHVQHSLDFEPALIIVDFVCYFETPEQDQDTMTAPKFMEQRKRLLHLSGASTARPEDISRVSDLSNTLCKTFSAANSTSRRPEGQKIFRALLTSHIQSPLKHSAHAGSIPRKICRRPCLVPGSEALRSNHDNSKVHGTK